MEIGSFIELQFPKGNEWYKGALHIARLNTGRAAIWHAFRVTRAKRIWLPYYQCESVRGFLQRKGCDIQYYHQDKNFQPLDLCPQKEDAVLLVNYFGIMSQERMTVLAGKYSNVIIANCQAFFCPPLPDVLNVYSARKFVGVPDGAYVVGENAHLYLEDYPQGYSSDTADFLLKRIEYGCEGKGYKARSINEHRIDTEGAMIMSKLTHAILDGTDYDFICKKHQENFALADQLFHQVNLLNPLQYVDDDTTPMVYPLLIEDDGLLSRLQDAKHFQGHWWSNICDELSVDCFEYWISRFMIPITIDQRYGIKELEYLSKIVMG